MPRFFLNLRKNGVVIEDQNGNDVENLEAVLQIAVDTLRDMKRLPHVYGEPAVWEEQEFIITDAAGTVLLMLPFGVMKFA